MNIKFYSSFIQFYKKHSLLLIIKIFENELQKRFFYLFDFYNHFLQKYSIMKCIILHNTQFILYLFLEFHLYCNKTIVELVYI